MNGSGVRASGGGRGGIGPKSCEARHVAGQESLRTLEDFELDDFAVVQSPEPVRRDRGVVDEDVLTRFLFDESEALAIVEPFHAASRHGMNAPATGFTPPGPEIPHASVHRP